MRPFAAFGVALVLALGGGLYAQDSATASRSINSFAWDMNRLLAAKEGNFLFSPYSISAALAMTREGAVGTTGEGLDRALHFPAGGLGASWKELSTALSPRQRRRAAENDPPSYRLEIANALFPQEGASFESAFTSRVKEVYDAGFHPLDFRAGDTARTTINAFVAERTHDRIKELLAHGTLSGDTRLVLTNAVWFKAQWTNQFSEKATKDEDFHLAADRKVTAKMMHRVGHYTYGETDLAQVLELPYGLGDTSFVVVLPKTKHGLAAVCDKEDPVAWAGSLAKGAVRVDAKLPRFTFSSGFELGGQLKQLGAAAAFDPRAADFSGLCKTEPFFIGLVIHKAFIALDEEGTEAAAATAVAMRAGARPNTDEPIPFVADHPFLFMIRHRATGTILFLGRLSDPTANPS